MSNSSKCKFRISVSKEQLDFILSCPDCPPDLRKIIELQLFKIQGGMATPAYELRQLQPRKAADLKPEQAYKMACSHLEMGKEIPAHLLQGYSTYRYENDLMNEEEQAQYEQEALGI